MEILACRTLADDTTNHASYLPSSSSIVHANVVQQRQRSTNESNGQQSDLQCFEQSKTMQSDSLGRWTQRTNEIGWFSPSTTIIEK
uniref:Uncharacterized protein n=1 Tax=Talaromyces marneffei PM1 TaxID=1077442 RepID=A0A093VIE5_TALMA